MFHPYVPGSYSPFGPTPSASPARSSSAFFPHQNTPNRGSAPLTPASPSDAVHEELRQSLHASDKADSDSTASSHASLYSASPVASEHGGNGKTVEFVTAGLSRDIEAHDNGEDSKDKESRSSRRSSSGDGYYTDEDDWRLYFEFASPTEPLHPASPPPPEFPFRSMPNAASSPLVNSLFAHVGSNPDPVAAFFASRSLFRPPTSMNRSYGTLGAHPFHRAPMAEHWGNVDASPPTPDELDSPITRRRSGGGVWDTIVSTFGILCCCASPSGGRDGR